MREIADAAGILSGSLYHHFDSKESMIEALLRDFLDRIDARVPGVTARGRDPVTTLRALVHVAFGALGDRPRRGRRDAQRVQRARAVPALRVPARRASRRPSACGSTCSTPACAPGDFRDDVPADAVYRFLRDAIWVSVRWYRPDGPPAPVDIADDYLDVLLGGLATRRPRDERWRTPTTGGPRYFVLDEIEWPDERSAPTAPLELVEEAERLGARRKFLARGEGGFHSQYSEFPPGYAVPLHSHDHDELILLLDGSCTMSDGQCCAPRLGRAAAAAPSTASPPATPAWSS